MGIPQDFFDVWGTRKRGREMRAEMANEREAKLRERAVRALERIADKEAGDDTGIPINETLNRI